MKTHINPKIITWAREKAGLTVEALAKKMRRDPKEIELWEQGKADPSYASLEKLAYSYLHVPLAVFFFPEAPNIEDPKTKLRRLPTYELDRFSPDTYQKFRLAQAYQGSLSELMHEIRFRKIIFRDILPDSFTPVALAQKAREYLGISVKQQSMLNSCEAAFKMWRHAIEEVGVFTFKDSFEDRFISGFGLLDEEYPVVFVNNSNSFSRQVFTLIHEMAHILYGVNGVTDIDESYIDLMGPKDRQIEIDCNRFAAHFLVPDDSFRDDLAYFLSAGADSISQIAEIADRYSVSREVILRRLLENRAVTKEYYERMAAQWNKEYLRRERSTAGGNYYLTRLAYLGEGFTRVAFDSYYRGRLSRTQLATHLNMNSRHLPKLESYMRW